MGMLSGWERSPRRTTVPGKNNPAARSAVRARTFVVPVLVVWSLAAVALVWQAYRRADAMAVRHAILDAREAFNKDVRYRRWVAGHGGVYVPVTAETPPNPFLADIPERDITTPSGRRLTLVNPAYMTRQVFESAAKEKIGPFGHITSLKPMRPENAPEPWEAEALRALERGAQEVSQVQQISGEPHLRLMSPLTAEEPCLKCHAKQGYKVGDLRGGISTSVPMRPFLATAYAEADWSALAYGLTWLIGVTGILMAGAGLRRQLGERRQAEEALRASEDLLQQSQSVARIGHYVLDVAAGTWSSSATLDEIFGIGPEHPHTVAGWLNLIHPDEGDTMRRYFGDNVLRDRQPFNRDYRIVRPSDGAVRWVHGTGRLDFAADGHPVRMFGVIQDITERTSLAEEKTRLEDQLRQAQKVEAIGRLAGGVAHDFNNLTAIVLGYGEMLLGQVHAEDPKHKYVQQIVEAGRRSAALTRQLLAFSRKQTLQPEVLDINALLRNLERMLGRVIGENIELQFRLAADAGRIKADPGQIEQAVTNLVLNARDAMPLGGRLTVETADIELDEAYARSHRGAVPGCYVMLALTDTGGGMDPATLSRLFEPFFTTKPKGKGTGLGLATVYGIVKQSGGYIWADSAPGAGTTFRIYLPRTDEELTLKAIEIEGAIPRGRGELILLVEDQAPLRGLCETVLSHLGYRVIAAGNGLEALNLVREERLEPELVVTDVIMPDMSGGEMTDRLRRDRPDLKVLYMSGYTDDVIASHGVLEPGMHFIEKPFTERALATKVREALGAKEPVEKAAAVPPVRQVLMIDDDEQFRELVRHFCTKRGHVFAGAESAAAALAVLAKQSFDVLLVDLNIPGTSGEGVLRKIRAAGCVVPAIVLTGDVASADMNVLRPLGAVCALEKSSNSEPLLLAIEAAVAPNGSGRAVGPP